MKLLQDSSGTLYTLEKLPNNKVKLTSIKFPEISHVYSSFFIESAMKSHLLFEIEEPGGQMKMQLKGRIR